MASNARALIQRFGKNALRLEDRNHDGCKYCMLNIRDELTRECLAIRIDLKLIASYLVGLSAMH